MFRKGMCSFRSYLPAARSSFLHLTSTPTKRLTSHRAPTHTQVIKGNTTAKFTVTFCASESRRHGGYLHGTQRVFSPESPLELRVWTAGENADRVGALLSGTFHPYAGAPPTPLQPLRVDLGAQAQACRLEPDGQTDLSWVVTSIQQPGSHAAFVRSVTLSNTAHCPQVRVRGRGRGRVRGGRSRASLEWHWALGREWRRRARKAQL